MGRPEFWSYLVAWPAGELSVQEGNTVIKEGMWVEAGDHTAARTTLPGWQVML